MKNNIFEELRTKNFVTGRNRVAVALNRNLRPRVRRLPSPPKIGPASGTSNLDPNIDTETPDLPLTDEKLFSTLLEDKANEIQTEIDEKEREEFLAARKTLLDELDGIFRQGFDSTLVHSDDDSKKTNLDYSEIRKRNYERAVADYEAAGKTLADSGLYSNASISYGCMILGKFLATNSLPAMYDEFQRIIEQIQHKQIIRSAFFSILTQLFESIAIKDKKGITRQLDRLKLIETFSTDDQTLIADSIQAITNLFAS